GAGDTHRRQCHPASAAERAAPAEARSGDPPCRRELPKGSQGRRARNRLHGERFGFMNPEWDNRFMDLLEADPVALTRMTHREYMALGGAESVELIMW